MGSGTVGLVRENFALIKFMVWVKGATQRRDIVWERNREAKNQAGKPATTLCVQQSPAVNPFPAAYYGVVASSYTYYGTVQYRVLQVIGNCLGPYIALPPSQKS